MSALPLPSTPQERPSLLKVLQTSLVRGLEDFFNWLFSPSPQAGQTRLTLRDGLFFLLWAFWTLTLYKLPEWRDVLAPLPAAWGGLHWFDWLHTLTSVPIQAIIALLHWLQGLLVQTIIFAFRTAFAPLVLRHLFALLAPYFLLRRLISVYLADVFEKDTDVAQRFLLAAAFGEDYATIRIMEGKILEDHQGSTIVQIGGPGFLQVDLDSAVLLEHPDGSTHIIGPTASHPSPKRSWFEKLFGRARLTPGQPVNGKIAIDAFERIRQCYDLRTINGSQTVSARSRDGIPITARDVQYTYSVYRGEAPQQTNLQPYPFDPKALEAMVYNPPRPVKMGGAPDTTPDWSKKMPSGIAGNVGNELGSFISKRSLTEFFTAIGKPEEEALRARASGVLNQGRELAGDNPTDAPAPPLKAPENFTSRSLLSEQILGELRKRLPGAGKQLHWLGIGTWDVPPETAIPARHLEAWNLTLENRRINSPDILDKLFNDAHQNELLGLLRQMPLDAYQEMLQAMQEGTQTEDATVDYLLRAYYERLLDAEKSLREHKQPIPATLQAALQNLFWLEEGDNAPNEFFIGYRVLAVPSAQVSGATVFQIETIFASRPLPGFFTESRLFEFGEAQQADFCFEVTTSAGLLNPQGMRSAPMRLGDLYCAVTFDLTLSPGQSAQAHLHYGQGALDLGWFDITLP